MVSRAIQLYLSCSNRSLNRDHLPYWSWTESSSLLICPIATEHTYTSVPNRDYCRDVQIRSSFNREFYLDSLTRTYMLSFLNGQWDRQKSHHLKYVYRDRTVTNLNESHKGVLTSYSYRIQAWIKLSRKFHDQLCYVSRSVRKQIVWQWEPN